jgi:hypothetical protein
MRHRPHFQPGCFIRRKQDTMVSPRLEASAISSALSVSSLVITTHLPSNVSAALTLAASSFGQRLTFSRLEALHRSPGFDQRAVDREVLVGQQRLDLRVGQDRVQEAAAVVAGQQPLAIPTDPAAPARGQAR